MPGERELVQHVESLVNSVLDNITVMNTLLMECNRTMERAKSHLFTMKNCLNNLASAIDECARRSNV